MYIEHTHNTSVLTANSFENHTLSYKLPSFIYNKSGWVHWQLLNSNQTGDFYIHPQKKVQKIENYPGPPSLKAGSIEKSMLVAMPVDALDNPMPKNTKVITNQHFYNQTEFDSIYTDGVVAYQWIPSQTKSGKIFLSNQCKRTIAKEMMIEVQPNSPVDFRIDASRVHTYADANQIVSFKTSVIKDVFGNIVANGTLVNFKIQNNLNQTFKTYGTTIEGIAQASIVHPESAQKWSVKGYIENYSQSPIIELDFKESIQDYNAAFDPENLQLKIGPFVSFIHQFIPDGLSVNITIYQNGNLIKEFNTQTQNGYAVLFLEHYIAKNKNYQIRIKVANITKELNIEPREKESKK